MPTTTVRGLSAGELLDVWETAWALGPYRRALVLLAAARRDQSPSVQVDCSVGQADAELVALRAATFGPHLTGVADCPRCGSALELELDGRSLLEAAGAEPQGSLSVDNDGIQLRFRVPTYPDLVAVADEPDADTARTRLLERCLLEARRDDRPLHVDELPAGAQATVASVMADADPGSDIQLATPCPECGHEWDAPFDPASFLWAEIDACARRLLGDVHTVATAYGWTEHDILAMSPWRRQIYLEAIGER